MVHLNSAVRLLDIAAEKYRDKTAIADEWSEITFGELQSQGKSVGTAIIRTDADGYMPSPVMVYLKRAFRVLSVSWAQCTARTRTYL